jgi:hypothetical protein
MVKKMMQRLGDRVKGSGGGKAGGSSEGAGGGGNNDELNAVIK